MPSNKPRKPANDNTPLTPGDRDAIRMALSLPDAQSLRAALRERLEAARLQGRQRRPAPYKPPRPQSGPTLVAIRATVQVPEQPAGVLLFSARRPPPAHPA